MVKVRGGDWERFDYVVLATQANQARRLLGDDATPEGLCLRGAVARTLVLSASTMKSFAYSPFFFFFFFFFFFPSVVCLFGVLRGKIFAGARERCPRAFPVRDLVRDRAHRRRVHAAGPRRVARCVVQHGCSRMRDADGDDLPQSGQLGPPRVPRRHLPDVEPDRRHPRRVRHHARGV
jgi:hypothetical protein